jgi:hypothetical protein
VFLYIIWLSWCVSENSIKMFGCHEVKTILNSIAEKYSFSN